MKNNYTIHIPKPCHENWDAMTPVEQGRFCQSCAKEVVDFSMMTDQEVLNYFSKATGNTCGRFNNDQLQRPLQPTKIEKKKAWWVALIMPFIVLFNKATAQKKQAAKNVIKVNESVLGLGEVVVTKSGNPTDYWPVQSDDDVNDDRPTKDKCTPKATTLTVTRKKGTDDYVVSGTVVNSRLDEPLPYATVSVKGTNTAVLTDSAGNFSIKGSTKSKEAMLGINYVGFESTDVLVQIKDSVEKQEDENYNISGSIVDAADSHPLAWASVVLKGHKAGTFASIDGLFKLKTGVTGKNLTLEFSYVGYKSAEVVVPLNNAVINIDTVKLEKVAASDITTGVIVCSYVKPKKVDTIPTYIRKVFNKEAFKVFPNPVQNGNEITVNIKKEGSYSIQLYNSNGSLILAQPFEAIKPAAQTSIAIPAGLTPGMYYIKLFDNKSRKQYTDKLIVM